MKPQTTTTGFRRGRRDNGSVLEEEEDDNARFRKRLFRIGTPALVGGVCWRAVPPPLPWL